MGILSARENDFIKEAHRKLSEAQDNIRHAINVSQNIPALDEFSSIYHAIGEQKARLESLLNGVNMIPKTKVNAKQFDGTYECFHDLSAWGLKSFYGGITGFGVLTVFPFYGKDVENQFIDAQEAEKGDWIIKSEENVFTVVKSDIFEQVYEVLR